MQFPVTNSELDPRLPLSLSFSSNICVQPRLSFLSRINVSRYFARDTRLKKYLEHDQFFLFSFPFHFQRILIKYAEDESRFNHYISRYKPNTKIRFNRSLQFQRSSKNDVSRRITNSRYRLRITNTPKSSFQIFTISNFFIFFLSRNILIIIEAS